MTTLRWILLVVALYFVIGAAVVLTLTTANFGANTPDRVEPTLIQQQK